MILLNQKDENKTVNSVRKSSYGILENDLGQIAVVRHEGWGLIFPGGKIDDNEKTDHTIIRETKEEIGYEITDLKHYNTFETYYDIYSRKTGLLYCHAIVDIYTGKILNKVQDPIETDTSIEWYYPSELFGKMKLDFQNIILEMIYNKRKIR